jgi:hypothetical protein
MELTSSRKLIFMVTWALVFSLICPMVHGQNRKISTGDEARYAALHPRGELPEVDLIPLASRVPDLNDKTVYIISSWERDTGFDGVLAKTEDTLKKHFPRLTIVRKSRGTAYYSTDDPKLWKEMRSNGAAFIYGAAPSSSTTHYAFTWSSTLEKMGLPGTVLLYDTLLDVAKGTRERLGAPLRYTAVPFPADTMTDKQVSDAAESLISALTTPVSPEEAKVDKYTPPKPPRIALTGTPSEIQDHFYKQGWTDGLPIIPPTEEKVAEMLKGTSHNRDEVVTPAMVPEKLRVTLEKVAVNAVMAGCKPAHMPVLLAAIEAYVKGNNDSRIRSTGSFSFLQVVNGAIRRELGMNGGTSAVGPGNEANAAIGRALRLFIGNLGGGRPGINMMGVIGNASNFSFCIPENEERSPWTPLSVERGFKAGESTLTLFSGGWAHTGNYGYTPTGLLDVAKDISVFEYPSGAVIMVAPARGDLLKAEGMSKEVVKEYIWKNATVPLGKLKKSIFYKMLTDPRMASKELKPEDLNRPDDYPFPAYPKDQIFLVVVGGETVPMMQAWHMSNPQTVSIDKWR